MESKQDKNGWRIILEYLGFSGGRINVKRCPGWPRDRGGPPYPLARPGLSWATPKAVYALILAQES